MLHPSMAFLEARYICTIAYFLILSSLWHQIPCLFRWLEGFQLFTFTLQVVRADIPCGNVSCPHPIQLMRFEDGNGFFNYRPCAVSNPLPLEAVMHDKVSHKANHVFPAKEHDLIIATISCHCWTQASSTRLQLATLNTCTLSRLLCVQL